MVTFDTEEEKEPQFFSVKLGCRIGGEQYRPSICYGIKTGLRATILQMAAKGDATLFNERQVFVNGVPRVAKV